MFGFSAFEVSGVSYIAFGNIRVFAYEFVNMSVVVINWCSRHPMVYAGISLGVNKTFFIFRKNVQPDIYMKEKLTMKNLRFFNHINSEGRIIRTPEGSEVGELASGFRLADWLNHVSKKGKISEKQYLRHATYLDSLPLVGAYYRLLCSNY